MICTIGHSTRPAERFLALLAREHIAHLVDVRRYPVSRRFPHFARRRLADALAEVGIGYTHAEALGGHRLPRPDSPHSALRNDALRGYADHMTTEAFRTALEAVITAAARQATVLMCAEAAPERCHRSLLADALVVRGVAVIHILDVSSVSHTLHPRAKVRDGTLFYVRQSSADLPSLRI